MRKRLIAGNWKLNGNWALCEQFVDAFASLSAASLEAIKQQADVVICPTAVYLSRFDALIQSTSSILQLKKVFNPLRRTSCQVVEKPMPL